MFHTEILDGRMVGLSFRVGGAFGFFGARDFGFQGADRCFGSYRFARLQQVHGAEIVEARPAETPTADAHWSTDPGTAPTILTADCVPVLLATDRRVCAVHAGWRGLELNILRSVSRVLDGESPRFVGVGPHIRVRSFEVGIDVATRLLTAAPEARARQARERYCLTHPRADKVYFNLSRLLHDQIRDIFGSPVILDCELDTMTDLRFHSFRRDGPGAGRQMSFVVLNR